MYRYDEIRHVHIEPSTRCNAACPMCPRNMNGATSPGLRLTDLSIEDIRRLLDAEFLGRLVGVDFCGAYGEPVLAPDILKIVEYVRRGGPACRMVLYTNGGIHRPPWWTRLAQALGRPARVVFGIDGIGEVNGVYRRNVRFDQVIANARAFIEAGGEAQWDFLIFRHNEHQIEQARAFSQELGFVEFQPKKSGRFVRAAMEYVPELDGAPDTDRFPIHSHRGQVIGLLEPPSDLALRNGSAVAVELLRHSAQGLDRMLDTTVIDCRVKGERSIYLGAQGYVFPCCQSYTAATLPAVYGGNSPADRQMERLVLAHGGFDAINARIVGLRRAVESELIAAVEHSWKRSSIADGRLKVCARVCGTELRTFEKQFASAELVPGRTVRS
ncbi:radical SAM protein [Dactylosporangium sp. CA-092794]|uniref:radical SAM protein n=1 Tax=Dactylosporangium sp. CA-092794 TaxID=3239929 RepID=UPI003D905F73